MPPPSFSSISVSKPPKKWYLIAWRKKIACAHTNVLSATKHAISCYPSAIHFFLVFRVLVWSRKSQVCNHGLGLIKKKRAHYREAGRRVPLWRRTDDIVILITESCAVQILYCTTVRWHCSFFLSFPWTLTIGLEQGYSYSYSYFYLLIWIGIIPECRKGRWKHLGRMAVSHSYQSETVRQWNKWRDILAYSPDWHFLSLRKGGEKNKKGKRMLIISGMIV